MLTEVRAHWKAAVGIVAFVLAAALNAFVISNQSTRVYTAEARLVVTAGLGRDGNRPDEVLAAPRIGQTYAELATTRPVLLDAIQRTQLPYDAQELNNRLSVKSNPDDPFLTVSITDDDPVRAATVANAVADILVERASVPASGTGVDAIPAQELLAVVEQASLPKDPSAPRVMFNTVMASAAALIVALVFVFLIAYVRNDSAARSTGGR